VLRVRVAEAVADPVRDWLWLGVRAGLEERLEVGACVADSDADCDAEADCVALVDSLPL